MEIKTKYKINEEFWAMLSDIPQVVLITRINIFVADEDKIKIEYEMFQKEGSQFYSKFDEKENESSMKSLLFKTKKELLHSFLDENHE